MKRISVFKKSDNTKTSTLDVELLVAVEACARAISVRDERELHRQLQNRNEILETLRRLLIEDADTFTSLKRLSEAARVESQMLAQLQIWRDEMSAQIDNLVERRRLARAFELD